MADLSHIPDEAVTAMREAADAYYEHDCTRDDECCYRRPDWLGALSAGLAAALPVLNTAKDSETARVDELDRWLNAGDVAGYASVEDLLNAMRVRRNWLAQGVPAIGPREIREAIAAELNVFASSFAEGRDALAAAGCPGESAVLGGCAKALRARAASLRGEQA